jgi:hypothetical protein
MIARSVSAQHSSRVWFVPVLDTLVAARRANVGLLTARAVQRRGGRRLAARPFPALRLRGVHARPLAS